MTNLEPLFILEADNAPQACTGEFDLESVKKLTMCALLCSCLNVDRSARICCDYGDDSSFTPSSQVQHEHSDNRAARRLQQLHGACSRPHIFPFNLHTHAETTPP
jgi:hypothetical protein